MLTRIILKYCLIALCVISPQVLIAQEWALIIDGGVESQNDKSDLTGAKVIVYRNGSKSDTKTTDAKGKFELRLSPNATYKLEFTYPGYVTKRIAFNTKNVPPEAAEAGDFDFKFDISLFKAVEGLDVSILNKPLAEISYDPSIYTFNYDKEYTKTVKAQIEKLQEEWEAKMAAEEAAAKAKEKEYQTIMADGAKAEARGDYKQAIASFDAALLIKPGDSNAASKKEDAQKKYEKDQAEKNKEKAYEEAIENAELALYDKKYKVAEAEFGKALEAKAGDTYARDQLKEVRDIMANEARSEQAYLAAISKGDAFMQQKKYLEAKGEYTKAKEAKPSEEYPKIQLEQVEALLVADAQRESEYIKAIERGESAMESKDYEAAKAAFQQAGDVKPAEKYPKDQLAKITAILAEIELQNSNYEAAIKKADAALAKNEFEPAKAAYKQALDLKPNEKYPQDQIAAITAKIEELATLQKQYAELIADADKRYTEKDYISAKAEYTKALELMPNENHPKTRIAEISSILEAEAKLDEDYKHAIENADNAFKAKDFQSAKFEYQSALKYKPEEAYPKEQLTEIEGLLAELAKKDEQYNSAIKSADNAFSAANFDEAKKGYNTALGIKPEEEYPKSQLAIVENKIVELANLNKQYDAAIASGDQQKAQGKFEDAKASFEKALAMKPSEAYPKEQIAAISSLIAESQKRDDDYKKLIAEGDAALDTKNYDQAKKSFSSASALKPDEAYPKEKISEIEKAIAEQAKNRADYDNAIAEADKLFNSGSLKEALPLYQQAAGLIEGESYPVNQIALIDNKLKELADLQANYTQAITKAEDAEKSSNLPLALASYKEALDLKPEEAYPKEKIKSLTDLIAENTKKDEEYKATIELADQALAGAEYDIAIAQYKKAQTIKPEESYPAEKLAESEKLKADALAAIELANKQQAEYDDFIKQGDALFEKKDFAASKEKYVAALDIKPQETYPKSRIGEIDDALANEAEREARDNKYNNLIAAADKAFASKDWENARSAYNEAQGVKPGETYPTEQLKAIDASIAEAAALAAQADAEAAEKEKQAKYDGMISEGDASFKAEDWEAAKTAYKGAKSIKPEETYPDDQLVAIDAAIAAALALASEQEKAMAIKEKQAKYDGLIAEGDRAFGSKDWSNAKSLFTQAQSILPNETYPSEQLKAIDQAIATEEALAAEAEKQAAEAEKQAKYNEFISQGDASFKAEDWESARNAYNGAKSVKPSESYPNDQLKAIDQAIAAAAALATKSELDAARREREANYLSKIAEGDAAFKGKDWDVARSAYKAAQAIKTDETYPEEQLAALEEAVAAEAALAAQMEKESAIQERNKKYQLAIDAADKAFRSEAWEDAKTNYNEALAIKSGETYPIDQLKLIDEKIANQGESAKREEYEAYISTADRAFKAKDWTSAESNYKSAQAILPNEDYPANQLARIAETLSKQQSIALAKENEEKYRQLIGDADQLYAVEDWQASKMKYKEALSVKAEEVYPKNQIALIEEKIAEKQNASANKESTYKELISEADLAFGKQSYNQAKSAYEKALAVKANESYPKQRIAEIQKILDEKEAALSLQNEESKKKEDYRNMISKADSEFNSKDYQSAKRDYRSALGILPEETYPKNKISEIDKLLLQAKAPATEVRPARPSSGMSEAEVAAMMLKWQQERDKAKVDELNQYQSELKEAGDDRVSNSEERRLDANDDLDNLEVTLRESNKAGAKRNLEEAALIDGVREDQRDFAEDKIKESENKRNDIYSDLEVSEMGQREMKEKGNRLYELNTEVMTTGKIEYQRQNESSQKAESDALRESHGELVDLEEDIREEKERGMDHYMEEVERIRRDNELVATTTNSWTESSKDRRADSYDNIVELEENIRSFKTDNKESYSNNTEKYWKDVEDMGDYADRKNNESLQRRNKSYGAITDYSQEIAEVTQEKNNQYMEKNEALLRDQNAISDFQAQLSANANEKRLEFDRNFYTGEDKPRYPEKASQYPQGVTEESFEEDDAYVIKRVVVSGENIDEYQKVFYKWGGVFYKKNGESTTEVIWNNETK
ncbi:MAG: hypothetical protein RH916_00450 [Vicingaceae bacterium]